MNGRVHWCCQATVVLAALIGCAQGSAPRPEEPARDAVVDALLQGRRSTQSLQELASRGALEAGQDLRLEELGRDRDTSHHLVTLRDREPLHRHDRHALIVVLLDGHGVMYIDGEERDMTQGSLTYVPRGAVHAFINHSALPAVAYVVYAPPYDGTDRQLAD